MCEIAASQAPSFSHGIAEQGLSTQSTSILDLKILGSCFEWINIARLPTLRFFMQPNKRNCGFYISNSHIYFQDDALVFQFAKSKGHQA